MKRFENASLRGRLMAGTVMPVALGVGLAIAAAPQPTAAKTPLPAAVMKSENPTAVRRAPVAQATKTLPDAVARPVQVAAGACGACGAKKGGCGACGAKKGACGACGAKKAGACGACGAGGPCGPCGGGGAVSKACVIPRLAAANPCAAKKGACGACGAKKAGACGACGAKKAGACGACGAKKAGACGACGAKKAGACGACGAKKAGACGACGAAKPAAKLTDSESAKAYRCLLNELRAAYSKSGHAAAKTYAKWKRYNTVAYVSETHGNRYVNNYGNQKAHDYIKYEKIKRMPVGAVLAKDSFQVMAGGKLAYGPLFLMTKMGRGWSKASGDWKYAMVMPDGTVLGTTKGKGADKVKFCYQCHISVSEVDSMLFIPKKYRVRR